MGFKKTSEGRVFFKSANNDDLPDTPINIPSDSQISKDSTQVQILLLLKTLNEKLQESREDNTVMKKTLETYKAKITSLEDHTLKQQNNYIDLEQKVAEKQNESSKKTTRVENSVKTTLKQLEPVALVLLALVFTIGLMFSSVEALILTFLPARAIISAFVAKIPV